MEEELKEEQISIKVASDLMMLLISGRWEVTRDDLEFKSYLFGTMHVPAWLLWDSVSMEARDAFCSSDAMMATSDTLSWEFVFSGALF